MIKMNKENLQLFRRIYDLKYKIINLERHINCLEDRIKTLCNERDQYKEKIRGESSMRIFAKANNISQKNVQKLLKKMHDTGIIRDFISMQLDNKVQSLKTNK